MRSQAEEVLPSLWISQCVNIVNDAVVIDPFQRVQVKSSMIREGTEDPGGAAEEGRQWNDPAELTSRFGMNAVHSQALE